MNKTQTNESEAQTMTIPEFEKQAVALQKRQSAFHRDARVIAAREAYRADLKNHVPEKTAWARANARYNVVRAELDLK